MKKEPTFPQTDAAAELSTQRVDFGEVAWGAPAVQQVSIQNSGTLPPGVSSIALRTGEMEGNFYEPQSSRFVMAELPSGIR